MPANPVPIDVKTKGQTWLLPPYNWSHRRIAKELDVSPSVVSKWRNELVESGLLSTEPPLESTTDYSAEQRFFIVIETATMSERELAEYCRSKGYLSMMLKPGEHYLSRRRAQHRLQCHTKKIRNYVRNAER
ncbi:helix-turn-helix domain-containing protein [Vibrio cyclitrophicus]